MFNKIVFDDQITLYWDKEWELPDGVEYKISVDGKVYKQTDKTHVEIENLNSNVEYGVVIERVEPSEVLFSQKIETLPKKQRLDITKPPYNAVGDGKTLNTKAIQQAVNDCKKDQAVYIPCGVFLTGAIDLHSDMELYIEKGGVLQGSENVEDYLPKIPSRFEGTELECYRSLINIGKLDKDGGYNCKNVLLRGAGKIVGGGRPLATNTVEVEKVLLDKFMQENKELVASCENAQTIPGRRRGRLININNCQNVITCGLAMGMGPSWNIHFVYSKDVITFGCKIYSTDGDHHVWNGDGWDPDSSENCVMFGSLLDTYDDGIAIKSGKNPEGNKINRPTKNVKIFDCKGSNAVAIGSELSGGIDGVYIWDCDFEGSILGLNIKTTAKRGGYVKNVRIRNCKLGGIGLRTKYGPNNDGEGAGKLTTFENLIYENLYFYGEKPNKMLYPENYKIPVFFDGFDEPEGHVKGLVFRNFTICSRPDGLPQQIYIKNVDGLEVEDVKFEK